LQPAGFAEDQALIPYPLNTFRGYRYLQEYFAFQDKFLFVDVSGLDVLQALPETLKQVRGLELRFKIRQRSAQRLRPTLDNVKLYCTPVVNLFKHDAVPIRLDGKQDEYLLLPSRLDSAHCAVFSVDHVSGWRSGGPGLTDYVPFESFEHDPSFDVSQARAHYSIRQRSSQVHDGLDTYLSLGVRQPEHSETLSVEMTCTNQNLPTLAYRRHQSSCRAKHARIPGVSQHHPRDLQLCAADQPRLSLEADQQHVAQLPVAGRCQCLEGDPRNLRPAALLRRAGRKSQQNAAGGLTSIRHEHVDRLHRGLPLRGVRTELTVDPQGYIGEGDLFVFASVLNEFFALYASLNSYHELRVTSTQGEVYQWTPRMGLQPLL
jgi:type VI secretion system protein ImpG